MISNWLRKTTLTASVTVALAGLGPAVAGAAPTPACPIHGSIVEGDITPGTTEHVSQRGETIIDVFQHPIYFDGGLSPVGEAHEVEFFHLLTNTFEVTDLIAFHGTARCDDGRVLGVGGLKILFVAHGDLESFTGRFQVVGSSGGLSGTRGGGTVTGVPGVPGGGGPFEGTLHR